MRHQSVANNLKVGIYFSKIISRKRLKTRKILEKVQTDVITLCNMYAKILNKLEIPALKGWAVDVSGALQSCYTIPTKELSLLKDSILENLKNQSEINMQRCAYCMLNEPRTWDHYMPKNDFPEYSVFHENLVYVCYGCNQLKSNNFVKSKLIYCHPYFTVDSDKPLLHCKITIINERLSIQYYGAGEGKLKPAGMVAQEHLTRLGLIDRFKGEAASTINGLIGELRQCNPNGVSPGVLSQTLKRKYAIAKERLGCNAWDSRLWHALAACPDFIAYVNREIARKSAPNSKGFHKPSPPPPK